AGARGRGREGGGTEGAARRHERGGAAHEAAGQRGTERAAKARAETGTPAGGGAGGERPATRREEGGAGAPQRSAGTVEIREPG
ncbi:RNA methyltransferase, partial [Mycobacterium tuberculosis]